MAVDKKKFNEYLVEQGRWQGGRCTDARNSDDGDIIACAVTASVLAHLQHAARSKVLTSTDIDTFLKAFVDAAGMVEVDDPMGGSHFERKPT